MKSVYDSEAAALLFKTAGDLDFLKKVANTPQLCCVTRLIPRQLAAGYLTEYWLPQLSNHS